MSEYIEHIDDDGIVRRVDLRRSTIEVALTTADECGSCPAARLCSVADSCDNRVEVSVSDPQRYKVGDKVTIRGTERMHRKAIMLATVLPCVALVAVMILVYLLTGGNQLAAALCGACATIMFFIVLWLMRNKIAHEFAFEVVEHADK